MGNNPPKTPRYIFIIDKSNCVDKREFRTILKAALREISQKRLKNDPFVKKLKKIYKEDTFSYKCPHCSKSCRHLEASHIGIKKSEMIDDIINEYGENCGFKTLYYEILARHKNVGIAICCKNCNSSFEKMKLIDIRLRYKNKNCPESTSEVDSSSDE